MFKALIFALILALPVSGLTVLGMHLLGGAPNPCETKWVGEIDFSFAKQVREDIKKAEENHCKKLTATLYSPGGSVIQGLDVVSAIRGAKKRGMTIAIRGETLVASMAVDVMAAGSKGERVIEKRTIVLIHPMTRGSMFSAPVCVTYVPNPTDEDQAITNVMVMTMAQDLAESSGKPVKEVLKWFECGKWITGNGNELVKLGLVDRLED